MVWLPEMQLLLKLLHNKKFAEFERKKNCQCVHKIKQNYIINTAQENLSSHTP
jgi:hypothetical protein